MSLHRAPQVTDPGRFACPRQSGPSRYVWLPTSGSPRTLPGQHRGERQEADVQVIKVNDEATRDQIAEAIAELRRRAKRLPRVSRQRDVLDEEVDALVDDWLRAEA